MWSLEFYYSDRRTVSFVSWTSGLFQFPLVLCFGFVNGLPLHVGWIICAATSESLDMIDNVARAGSSWLSGRWTWMLAFERCYGAA
jgi:hypothetical protein